MIESLNATADVPLLLRALCYLGGIGLCLSTLTWLGRLAFGMGNVLSLRQITGVWLVRILAACTMASLSLMIFNGQAFAQPALMVPEAAILLLLAAMYLLIEKRRFTDRRHIIANRLPGEVLKIAGVTGAAIGGMFVVLGFLGLIVEVNTAVGGPEWAAVLATGLLSLAPYVAFFIMAKERGATEKLKFYQVLAPLLLACFLMMLPDMIHNVRNSPDIEEMMHARGRLQKVETIQGKHRGYA